MTLSMLTTGTTPASKPGVGAVKIGIEMKLTQRELDSSKAWKDYKALVEKAFALETVAELKKLQAGSDSKYDQLREFFKENKQLSSDLVDRCRGIISNRIQLYTPTLARLAMRDYESIVKEDFVSLNRSIRIVDEFRKAQLQDDFIESIRKNLPRSVSAIRSNLAQLEKARIDRPPKKPISKEESIEALTSALQILSDKADQWEVESRVSAGQSRTDFLLQSELDTSIHWKSYCGIHWLISAAKTVDSLLDLPNQATQVKNDLAKLFRDAGIAESLVAWVKLSCEVKGAELKTPKLIRGTAEDWERLLSEFAKIQTELRIAGFFHDHSLGHSLIWTATGRLSPRSQNLANNAREFRTNAGYKDAAPGAWKKLTAKQEKTIQEIEAFDQATQRTLASWKMKPK